MKTRFNIFILAIFCLLNCWSCGKSGGSNCPTGGGKGGSVTLKVIPEHANYPVDSCIIYIKYGATDAPSNGLYDDSAKVIVTDSVPIATFINLSEGNYYVLGKGYHALLSENVKGGLPCSICSTQPVTLNLPTYPY